MGFYRVLKGFERGVQKGRYGESYAVVLDCRCFLGVSPGALSWGFVWCCWAGFLVGLELNVPKS